MTVLLVVLAVGFAFAIGAHYTGACMGMPHALGAVSAWQALWIMAPLAFAGAALASHGVEHTVGHGLTNGRLTLAALSIVIGVAFALTMLFNQSAVPTSTIQILVFTVIGVALAAGAAVAWRTIAILAVTWAAAPVVAVGLGYLLTRLLDLVPAVRAGSDRSATAGTSTAAGTTATALRAGGALALALTAVGAAASFTMGANDVANATGPLVGAGLFSPLTAGLIGGAGIAAGVLTWGRPLLSKVAFDIVTVDRPMATAAQLIQAVVVLVAVSFGLFTSMNQALVGAMAGAGLARGKHTVHAASLYGILRGWLIGPGAGITAGFLLALAAKAAGAVLLAQA
ncbi:MAG TPA: inorganic phosphate transporter [Streptosporangiaceae bacterium]|nr:inorganic phosphate transporter [Streptosporangiaceae bacterium]